MQDLIIYFYYEHDLIPFVCKQWFLITYLQFKGWNCSNCYWRNKQIEPFHIHTSDCSY